MTTPGTTYTFNLYRKGEGKGHMTMICYRLFEELPEGTKLTDYMGREHTKGAAHTTSFARSYAAKPDVPMLLGFPATSADESRDYGDWQGPYRES